MGTSWRLEWIVVRCGPVRWVFARGPHLFMTATGPGVKAEGSPAWTAAPRPAVVSSVQGHRRPQDSALCLVLMQMVSPGLGGADC